MLLLFSFVFIIAICGTSAAAVTGQNTSVCSNDSVSAASNSSADPVINGTVTINEYGTVRPLQNATVTVNSMSNRTLGSATTDQNGYYSISFYSTDNQFKVTASYLGCNPVSKTVTVTLNNTNNISYGTSNLQLTPMNATLVDLGNGAYVYIKSKDSYNFAGIIHVTINGTTYDAYCIDLYTDISTGDRLLVNGALPGTTGNLSTQVDWGKVNYILSHYSGTTDTEAAAIQCAIWYFTSVQYGVYPGNDTSHSGYYQFMTYNKNNYSSATTPYDGYCRGWFGYDKSVYNRAWQIINAAVSMQYPTNITLTPETTRVSNGQSTTLTATVTDKNGNPLSGITVTFKTSKGTLSTTTGTTNSNGQVSTILSGLTNSTATVTAGVSGNYGVLLYDNPKDPKQDLVTVKFLPYILSDTSIVNFDVTANVQLNQTANSPVNVGDNVTYTVTAKNNGPNTATGIIITDAVPSGLTNVTVTPSAGTSYVNGVWTIPTLINGATATLTITGNAGTSMAGTTTTNTATRTAQNEYNSQPTTTSASVYTKMAEVKFSQTSTTPANVGDNVTYVVTVTNEGPDTATNTIITDNVPSGLTNVTVTPSAGTTYVNGVWTIPSLINGASATLTITGNAGAAMAGTITTNIATKTGETEYDPTTIGEQTTADIYTKEADVVLTQTGNYSGSTVTFVVTATNNGPDTATNINITDIIPAGLTNFTVNPSIGTYSNGIWTIPTLANGAIATLTITGNATPETTTTNTANKTSQTEYDPTPDSTTKSIYTPAVDINVLQYPWYYDSTAKAYVTSYELYNTPVFIVDVRNSKLYDDATGVIIEYIVGTGFKYIDLDTHGIGVATFDGNQTITWIIGNMPKNSDVFMTVMCQAIETGNKTTDLTNIAKLKSVNEKDMTSTYNQANVSIEVPQSADIQVNQTQQNNTQNVTYTITVTNNGPENATGVQITDKLSTGLTFTSADTHGIGTYDPTTGIWDIGTLNNGTTVTLTLNANITGTGTIKNNAAKTQQTNNDWNLDNNSQQNILIISGQYTPTCDIHVLQYPWYYDSTAKAYVTSYELYNTPVFIVDVRNSKLYDDATGVIIEYIVGTGFKYIDLDTHGIGVATFDGNQTITWIIGNMPKNSDVFMTVMCQAIETGNKTTDLTNIAKLKSVNEKDMTSTYNQANVSIEVPQSADIQVNQTQQNNTQNVTYTITVTNNGPENATGVQITDKLSTGLTFTSADTHGIGTYDPTTGIWDIGTLNNGTTVTLTLNANITGTGTIKNNAAKTQQTNNDWNLDNNSQQNILITTTT
ncbi:conserved repeat domain protein [Methanobacterium paludis]|uniref:Conserved repeat domain protein n=2 Tax=Methanobacterium paludis (strain DSM 25820 / JCM 18151 / SWAN1) TaxID=868131 RepID=F6D722_METPW|nr:conserved repeat domain protein [Methanobacterium paludis]